MNRDIVRGVSLPPADLHIPESHVVNARDQSKREHLDAPPIELIHRQVSPNATIALGSFQASFCGDAAHDADLVRGEAHLRFTPRKSIELVIPAPEGESVALRLSSALTKVGDDGVTLHLSGFGTAVDVFCTSASSERSVFVSRREPIQVFPPSTSIDRAIFHLMNWPNFWGPESYVLRTGTPPRQEAKVCGLFTLNVDGWKVTVAATDQTDSAVKSLDETGGFTITHVGSIQRTDGGQFSTEQLEETLTLLSYFFSFVFGRWSSPCLSIGFDASGTRVYEEWGVGRCAENLWSGSGSWFDPHHSEFFADALPGFWRLWSDKTWRRPMTKSIYWYMEANRAGSGLGVDSALLFTQAALELLSWTYCVLDRKMVSANAFKPRGLSAADKLRLLASSLGIPLEIPPELSALRAKPGTKWDDSMDAITDLRNGLVHPGKEKTVPEGTYYDAWRLSMWYLDLILLRLCEYQGDYSNRLAQRYVGQVVPVPWSPKLSSGQGSS